MQNLQHSTHIFASAKLHQPFKWGQEDCNTLALDFIDLVHPSLPSIINEVRGHYHTSATAREFYRNYRYTWHSYLTEIGFKEVEPMFFQAGDFHIHKVGTDLEAVSINLGKDNIIADLKKGICLTSFFGLYDKFEIKAYRYKGGAYG